MILSLTSDYKRRPWSRGPMPDDLVVSLCQRWRHQRVFVARMIGHLPPIVMRDLAHACIHSVAPSRTPFPTLRQRTRSGLCPVQISPRQPPQSFEHRHTLQSIKTSSSQHAYKEPLQMYTTTCTCRLKLPPAREVSDASRKVAELHKR